MSDGAPALSKLSWQKKLRGADLTHAEYRVLMTIASYTDKHLGNAHPGWARIAADACVREKTAKDAVRALMTKGWLRLTSAGGNQYGKGVANTYALTVPAINKGGGDRPPSGLDGDQGRGAVDDPRGGGRRLSKGGGERPPIRKYFHQGSSSSSFRRPRPTGPRRGADARLGRDDRRRRSTRSLAGERARRTRWRRVLRRSRHVGRPVPPADDPQHRPIAARRMNAGG
ncbi:helix-turn-helix domain-containing protein [Actinotalea ferrariae]|nr:helix-turn-helix domain-containing protein [Actinotalea ferrariae]